MRALLNLALGSFIKEHLASVVDPLFSIPFPQFAVRVDPNLGPKKEECILMCWNVRVNYFNAFCV